jgi:hypothetical protein
MKVTFAVKPAQNVNRARQDHLLAMTCAVNSTPGILAVPVLRAAWLRSFRSWATLCMPGGCSQRRVNNAVETRDSSLRFGVGRLESHFGSDEPTLFDTSRRSETARSARPLPRLTSPKAGGLPLAFRQSPSTARKRPESAPVPSTLAPSQSSQPRRPTHLAA